MIKINEVIIVEGKYDKIKLDAIIDGTIIQTNGFRIFKDKKKMDTLRCLAKQKGIIVLTDSDSGGFIIRNYLNKCIPNEYITHIYTPNILGKEKRKETISKEGKLGVEGMDSKILEKLFLDAGISLLNKKEISGHVTIADFYLLGFIGKDNSKLLRNKLVQKLNLPEYISTKRLIEIINLMMSNDEFLNIANDIILNSK